MFTFYELLQKLGSTRNVKEPDFTKCWPHIEDLLANTLFKQKFQSASEKERELLVKIAKSQAREVSPKNFHSPNILFTRLEQKELLIHQDRGSYTLFHPLFKEYLAKQ
jgi:hypothetical protein